MHGNIHQRVRRTRTGLPHVAGSFASGLSASGLSASSWARLGETTCVDAGRVSRHCRAPHELGSLWRRLIEAPSRNGHSAVPRRLTDPMSDWARREVRGARVEVRQERVRQMVGGGGGGGVGRIDYTLRQEGCGVCRRTARTLARGGADMGARATCAARARHL